MSTSPEGPRHALPPDLDAAPSGAMRLAAAVAIVAPVGFLGLASAAVVAWAAR